MLGVVVLEPQLADGHRVRIKVGAAEVLQQGAALVEHPLQTPASGVILAVLLQMLREVRNLLGQPRDWRRAKRMVKG